MVFVLLYKALEKCYIRFLLSNIKDMNVDISVTVGNTVQYNGIE